MSGVALLAQLRSTLDNALNLQHLRDSLDNLMGSAGPALLAGHAPRALAHALALASLLGSLMLVLGTIGAGG